MKHYVTTEKEITEIFEITECDYIVCDKCEKKMRTVLSGANKYYMQVKIEHLGFDEENFEPQNTIVTYDLCQDCVSPFLQEKIKSMDIRDTITIDKRFCGKDTQYKTIYKDVPSVEAKK